MGCGSWADRRWENEILRLEGEGEGEEEEEKAETEKLFHFLKLQLAKRETVTQYDV